MDENNDVSIVSLRISIDVLKFPCIFGPLALYSGPLFPRLWPLKAS